MADAKVVQFCECWKSWSNELRPPQALTVTLTRLMVARDCASVVRVQHRASHCSCVFSPFSSICHHRRCCIYLLCIMYMCASGIARFSTWEDPTPQRPAPSRLMQHPSWRLRLSWGSCPSAVRRRFKVELMSNTKVSELRAKIAEASRVSSSSVQHCTACN